MAQPICMSHTFFQQSQQWRDPELGTASSVKWLTWYGGRKDNGLIKQGRSEDKEMTIRMQTKASRSEGSEK